MDQFEERLSRLAELNDDEVSTLEAELVAAFDEADNGGDVDTMAQIADAVDLIRAEADRRTNAPAPEEAAPAAAEEVMAASAETATQPSETVTETTEPTVAEAAPAVPAPTDTEAVVAEAEAIVEEAAAPAAAPAVAEAPADAVAETTSEVNEDTVAETVPEGGDMEDAELTADGVPDENKPELEDATPAAVIRAGGDIPGVTAGSQLDGLGDVAEAMTARINGMRHLTGGSGEQIVVASIQTATEDEDRTLRPGDAEGNSRKLRQVVEMGTDGDPIALTAAANGWCAPRTPIYTLFGLGDTDRPVKDSLPGFNADRGGVIAATPPVLSGGNYGAGLWQFLDDAWASSASPTGDADGDAKIIFDVECNSEFTVDLEAITSQLRFTNPMARAYPELVRRNMELALIAHARFAETRLLKAMWEASTTVVGENPSIPLGATRDTLVFLRTIVSSFRNRHRMASESVMEVWAPAWLRDLVAIDLTVMAGDAGGDLSPALSEIDGYLKAAKISPTWYLDGVPGAAVSQFHPTDHTFPASAAIVAAPPGTFMFLDGGSLDLGVIRDADLVGSNQYLEFTETFEALAMMGVEAMRTDLPVTTIGAAADYIDTTAGIILS